MEKEVKKKRKLKFIEKLLIFVIVASITGVVSIFSIYNYQNQKLQDNIQSVLKETTALEVNQVDWSDEEETQGEDLAIDDTTVNENQKVKAVKSYKNVLSIPQYKIKANIYPDVSRESLAYGVGHYPQTVPVGEKGNCSLAGHSSVTFDCILNPVKDMSVGDTFICYDKNGKKHTYYVVDMTVVEPTQMEVLETIAKDTSYVKLITCTNYGKQRLVITGAELEKTEAIEMMNKINRDKVEKMIDMNEDVKVNVYILKEKEEDEE